MHRQRFGSAAVFGWSPPGHEQGGGAKRRLSAAWEGADARCPVEFDVVSVTVSVMVIVADGVL